MLQLMLTSIFHENKLFSSAIKSTFVMKMLKVLIDNIAAYI